MFETILIHRQGGGEGMLLGAAGGGSDDDVVVFAAAAPAATWLFLLAMRCRLSASVIGTPSRSEI